MRERNLKVPLRCPSLRTERFSWVNARPHPQGRENRTPRWGFVEGLWVHCCATALLGETAKMALLAKLDEGYNCLIASAIFFRSSMKRAIWVRRVSSSGARRMEEGWTVA